MINGFLCSDRYQFDVVLTLPVKGNIAEVYRKVKKDYCKIDQIYDQYIVDASADDLGCDTSKVSGDDQEQEGKACSLGGSGLISFHHVYRP